MHTRHCLSIVIFAGTFAAHAGAQTPAAEITYRSAADLSALTARVSSERPIGAPMNAAPLLRLPPYLASLEVRAAPGPAALHEKEAEMFVVLDGAGSIVTGGKLVAETHRNGDTLSAGGIEGGVVRKIAKGDIFIVPENTPHWFNAVDGRLVLMSFHVPRPVPARP